MKKAKKVLLTVLAFALVAICALSMAACGDDKPKDKNIGAGTYVYEWRSIDENQTAVPYKFGVESMDMSRAYKLELKLKADGTYEMTVAAWMIEDTEGGTVPVGDKFPFGDGMYFEWSGTASGTYTSTETTVTTKMTSASYKLPDLGTSYLAQLFGGGSTYSKLADGDYYYGEWNTDSTIQAVKDQFKKQYPDTTFTIKNGKVTNWIKVGYELTANSQNAKDTLYFYKTDATFYGYVNNAWINGTYKVEDSTVTLTYRQGWSNATMSGSATTPIEYSVTTGEGDDAVTYTTQFALTAEQITAITPVAAE